MTEETYPRMSEKFFRDLLKSDFRLYYTTKNLNNKLYLHYKGFRHIENLQDFTALRVIYLEGNALDKIEGLSHCTDLRCLYLQQNCIRNMEGLYSLVNLYTLNLNDNMIETISDLAFLTRLNTLSLQRNNVGRNGLSDLSELLHAPSISVLDLSHNKIEDERVLPQVFELMPNLSVLYLQGNPVCKKIPNYRKTMINNLKALKFLDDRPVFEEDRRFSEAFIRGGVQAEREERKKWQSEREEERLRNHEAFRAMINGARRERQLREEAKSNESTNNETDPSSREVSDPSSREISDPSSRELTDPSSREQTDPSSEDNGSQSENEQAFPFVRKAGASKENEAEEIPFIQAKAQKDEFFIQKRESRPLGEEVSMTRLMIEEVGKKTKPAEELVKDIIDESENPLEPPPLEAVERKMEQIAKITENLDDVDQ